jgi:flagellar hook protein FlgE
MSFFTALSGLKAAQTDLGVIANNVANVGTVGFKKSITEFGDLISSGGNSSPGQGVRLRNISQQFTPGGFENTGRTFDLAISGTGFFVTRSPGGAATISYTRNGTFRVDSSRNVTDSSGNLLQVLPTDPSGSVTATGASAIHSLQLPLTSGNSQATTEVNLGVTLPSDADIPADRSVYTTTNPYVFDRDDANSYNFSTTTTVYDSAGSGFPMTTYYTRETAATGTQWNVHTFIGSEELTYDAAATTQPAPLTLTFDSSGVMTAPTGGVSAGPVNPTGSTESLSFDVTYGANTRVQQAPFALTSFSQDGFAAGQLDNVSIGVDGLVVATFSNGDSQALGKIVLATFSNPEGLRQLGDSKWGSTGTSGEPIFNEANSNGMGLVQSGALEQSNVDITEELVALIQAQRNYSANAKAIETANTITQTIVNLRS